MLAKLLNVSLIVLSESKLKRVHTLVSSAKASVLLVCHGITCGFCLSLFISSSSGCFTATSGRGINIWLKTDAISGSSSSLNRSICSPIL